ncbi:hypothetical protein D3C75_894180 [compost metagenome]
MDQGHQEHAEQEDNGHGGGVAGLQVDEGRFIEPVNHHGGGVGRAAVGEHGNQVENLEGPDNARYQQEKGSRR